MKSCKSHEKKWNEEHQTLSFKFFINSILMFFVLFFHVVCKISNFNMWTAKHLVQASCTELTLTKLSQITKFVVENESKKCSEIAEFSNGIFLFWITVPIAESVVLLWGEAILASSADWPPTWILVTSLIFETSPTVKKI